VLAIDANNRDTTHSGRNAGHGRQHHVPYPSLVALDTARATSIRVAINNENDSQEFLPDVTAAGHSVKSKVA
jgi:hypothetical protein